MSPATRYPAVDPGHTTSILVANDTAAGRREQSPAGGEQPASHASRSGRRPGWELVVRIVQVVLFATLVGSVVYAAIHLSTAPQTSTIPSVRVRGDFVLMLLQCGGGLIVMFLPGIVQRRLGIAVPSVMQVGYLMFLYASIYLGEVCSFYYRFPFWDSILHFLSGVMLATLGFLLVQLLNGAKHRGIALSPMVVAFFAFCFAVAGGAIWEIYEYSIDGLFGTNMQKVATDTGQVLTGRDALVDTMSDLFLNTTAALIVAIAGYRGLHLTTTVGAQRGRPLVSSRQHPADSPSAPNAAPFRRSIAEPAKLDQQLSSCARSVLDGSPRC